MRSKSMVRWSWGVVAVASNGACGPERLESEQADSTSAPSSSDGTFATTGPGGTQPDPSTTTSTASEPETTTAADVPDLMHCPEGSDDLGAVNGIVHPDSWILEGEQGISEGVCSAVDYDGERLTLECVQTGAGPEQHTLEIVGGGPVVGDMLGAMVGMTELQLEIAYALEWIGIATRHHTLRTSTGDLPVLGSWNQAEPGGTLPVLTLEDGWTAPFTEIWLADPGCAPVLNPPDTCLMSSTPLAIEIGTEWIFHRQQGSVSADGQAYELSVLSAELESEPCGEDFGTVAIFSIVRRL